jgi:hypothetical protein
MDGLLDSLNHYSNLVTAASTAGLVLFTLFLWIENHRLRKSGSAPEVVSYLLPHPHGNGAIQFILANIGKGPAFEVKFDLVYDEDDFKAHNVMLENDKDRMPISVLPQNEEIKSLFGISFELYGQVGKERIDPLKSFKVRIEYTDSFGRKKKRERTLDIRQFAGLRGALEKSNARQIAQSLESIEQHMATVARQSRRFSAFVDVTEIGDQFVQVAKGASSGDAAPTTPQNPVGGA